MLLCGISSFDTDMNGHNPDARFSLAKNYLTRASTNGSVLRSGKCSSFSSPTHRFYHHFQHGKPSALIQTLCHANYPSLPVFPFCVNRKILKIYGFITIFYFFHSTQCYCRMSILENSKFFHLTPIPSIPLILPIVNIYVKPYLPLFCICPVLSIPTSVAFSMRILINSTTIDHKTFYNKYLRQLWTGFHRVRLDYFGT